VVDCVSGKLPYKFLVTQLVCITFNCHFNFWNGVEQLRI
jgi:hypothetical protein